ncbi:MAG TPA: LysM peptidoglycan-binding domain-containing protein [Chloroflexota bacterium]|nr:LysM peptidoglycan-binding domain-containing protein [Chloroflexota bacterium]
MAAVAGLLLTPLLWTAIWPFLDALFVGAVPLAEPLTGSVVAAGTATTAPLPRIVGMIPVISGETVGPAGTVSIIATVTTVATPEGSATGPANRASAVPMPDVVSTAAATPAPTAPPTRVPTAVATAIATAVIVAPGTPATPVPLPPVQPTAVPAQVYVVQRGDTLYSIARRHGTTVDSLVLLNGLGSKDTVLRVGFQLVIPR